MSREKKFVFGIALLNFVFIVVVWGLAWVLPPMRYMDGEYPYWQQQADYINADDDRQEVLLLGDSRLAAGIVAGELGNSVHNLAMGGATPIEMYYSLKKYLQHHPKPKAIIIAFTPLHYYMLDKTYFDRALYFHYFSSDEIAEINANIERLDGRNVTFECLPYTLRLPSVYMNPIMKSLAEPQTKQNQEYYDEAKAAKGSMSFANPKDMDEVITMEARDLPQHFELLNSLDYYMGLLIKLCQSEDIPVCIEQLPMGSPGLAMLQDAGYIADYTAYIEQLAQRYAVPTETEIPLFDNKYFMDNDAHLNKEGAKIFTAMWRKKYYDMLQ